MISKKLLHFYRSNRAHQLRTYGGSLTVCPSGRTELTGGSAAYGFHALAAYQSARSHIYFMANLARFIKQSKARSAAARRGWEKRRAGARND